MEVLQLTCIFWIHDSWIEMSPLEKMASILHIKYSECNKANVTDRTKKYRMKWNKSREKEKTNCHDAHTHKHRERWEQERVMPKMQFICHQRERTFVHFTSPSTERIIAIFAIFKRALIECIRLRDLKRDGEKNPSLHLANAIFTVTIHWHFISIK